MSEVRRDKYGRPDRTHLLSSSGTLKENPRRLPLTVYRDMSKEERRAMLATEHIQLRIDAKGKEVRIDKKFLNTDIWVELTEYETVKAVFGSVEPDKVSNFDDYRFFVAKNSPLLLDVKVMEEEKMALIKANDKAINAALIKNKTWSRAMLENKTLYEIKTIVETYNTSK
jgi:hypothetical protein